MALKLGALMQQKNRTTHIEPDAATGVSSLDTAAYPVDRRRPLPLGLRLVWLSYLALYFFPWWFEPPSRAAVAATLVGIAVFLPLYFYAFKAGTWGKLAAAAGMLAIGFLLQPCNGIWAVFPIFAASTAGNNRPARLAIFAVAGVVAATALFGLVMNLPFYDWGWGVFLGVTMGAASLCNASMRERDEQLALAREDARRYAVLAERERIARDLHDVLGHTMTMVAMKADLAKRLMAADPESALREVDQIHAAARKSLGEIRTAVTGMRSTTLAAELVESRRTLESAGVALESTSPAEPLPPLVETALAYVIREAATNVVRHSNAQHCRIHLWREGPTVRLAVQDNGRGGQAVEGQGITGMRQRLAAVGGSLEVRGNPGFRLEACVPLENPLRRSPQEPAATAVNQREEV